MNKPIIILFLIFMILSCGKRRELPITEGQLQNRTFNVFSESEQDTLFIEFQDSTHQIFGSLWQGQIPWRISHYENANFLVLDNRIIGIKKTSEEKFDCTYIGLMDNPFVMVERKPKWNKEQIYGTWIEEKYILIDSADFPPPPLEIDNLKWNWPPYYIIDEKKIKLDLYEQFESEIEINNSNEFIKMDLYNSVGLGIRDHFWHIKYLSDSIMIIDKKVDDMLKSHGEKKLTNIKLIKKR